MESGVKEQGTAVKSWIFYPTRQFIHLVIRRTHETVQDRETHPCPDAGGGNRDSHVPAPSTCPALTPYQSQLHKRVHAACPEGMTMTPDNDDIRSESIPGQTLGGKRPLIGLEQ